MTKRAENLRLPVLAAALLLLGGCGLFNAAAGLAPLAATKMQFACIPEGTRVDTPAGPRAIETLRAGDLVIGFDGETVRILQKHAYAELDSTKLGRSVTMA